MLHRDHMPKHDPDAERGLLAALFRGQSLAEDVFSAVTAEAFYLDAHQKLFASAHAVHEAGKPLDVVVVRDELRRRGHHEDVGGDAYLGEVLIADPTGVMWRHYAGIVIEDAALRALVRASTEALRDALDAVMPAVDIAANLDRAMVAMAAGTHGGQGEPKPLGELVRDALGRIDERHTGTHRGGRVMTGLDELDGVLGGLRPGTLTVVAARPSVGKTSLALTTLVNAARAGQPGLLFSLEMSGLDIADRFLAMEAEVSLGEIVGSAALHQVSIRRLVGAGEVVPAVLVDADSTHTAASIATVARRAVRRHGVRIVAIDYLGLVSADRGAKKSDRRDLELGAMVKAFKRLAKQCDIPVMLLAQLNRQVESRADHRPVLSDLKDSGELEADADIVILLKPEAFTPGSDTQTITAIIAKNRQGQREDVGLIYRRPFVRFENAGIPL